MADPGCHTRAHPFSLSLFTLFSLFWVLQQLSRIPPFWYSPGPFSGTRSDPTFLVLTRIPPFPILARIPPFRYSPRFPHFWYSLGSYLFRYSPGFPHFQYSPGSYLFRYSPEFYLLGTSPDPTFPVLARILPFPVLT